MNPDEGATDPYLTKFDVSWVDPAMLTREQRKTLRAELVARIEYCDRRIKELRAKARGELESPPAA